MKKLFKELNQRPIAYHRVYTQITGQLVAGVLLSQLIYWAGSKDYQEFYKTNKEISEETGLALWEVKKGKKRLSELGLVTITLKSLPRKTYYLINLDKIISSIAETQQQPVGAIHSNKLALFTPTTSETTTEITNKEDINTSKLSLDGEFFEETKHIILTYFAKYKQTFGKQHPFLKKDKLLKVADIIQMQEYEQDDFDDMIDVYFGIYANNPEVDCNILHFANNRMLEILYCRSL